MEILNLKRPIVFFDVETTGKDVATDKIIEFAAVKLLTNGETYTMSIRINPEIPIKQEAIDVHGITNEMLEGKATFKQVAPAIFSFIKNCDLSGFNILRFDLPILVEEFLRFGIPFPGKETKFLDSSHIYHKMNPRTLSAAYKHYVGEELEGAHGALEDAKAAMVVMLNQITLHGSEIGEDANAIHEFCAKDNPIVDFAGKLARDAQGEIIYNFGKDKGKRVKSNQSFGMWMMQQPFFTKNTKSILKELMNCNCPA